MAAGSPAKPRRSLAAILVGGLLFVIAGLLIYKGATLMAGRAGMWTWEKTPCVLEKFGISADPKQDPPFRADLDFRYVRDGREFHGTRLWPDREGEYDYETLSGLREELAGRNECFVNPSVPGQAALLRGGGGGWLDLVVIAIGAVFGCLGLAIIRSDGKAREPAANGFAAYVFCGFFTLIGLGVLGGIVAPGLWRAWDSRRWVATPAEVVWSRTRPGSARADIFYRYTFQGKEYFSNRYSVNGDNDRKSAAPQVVGAHPAGSSFTCLVNPTKPWMARVEPGAGPMTRFAFATVLAVPFAAIGIAGWVSLWRGRGRGPFRSPPDIAALEMADEPDAPEAVLAFGTHRRSQLKASIVSALLWIGFAGMWAADIRSGEASLPWPLPILVVIGLFMVGQGVRRALALNLPSYEVRLVPGTLRPAAARALPGGRPEAAAR